MAAHPAGPVSLPRRLAGSVVRLVLLLLRAVPPPIWALVLLFVLLPGVLPGAPGPVNSSQLFERNTAVSIPRRASSRSAPGCGALLGLLPALNARTRPSPRWLNSASPRIERALLPVHRTSTVKGVSVIVSLASLVRT